MTTQNEALRFFFNAGRPTSERDHVLTHGFSVGGTVALAEALGLWERCAEGNADYPSLGFNDASMFVRLRTAQAGFRASVEVLRLGWSNDRSEELQAKWRAGARLAFLRAAGHLLSVYREIERGNRACADFKHDLENDEVLLNWKDRKNEHRFVVVRVQFSPILSVSMEWDTGTETEDADLALPSMTDEADRPEIECREGGWVWRMKRN